MSRPKSNKQATLPVTTNRAYLTSHGGIIECNAVLCCVPAIRRLPCGAPMCDKHYRMYMALTGVMHCTTCDGHNPHCMHGDEAYHDNTLVTVQCIYGHTYRVLRRHLNNPRRIQLPLFTPDGRRYSGLSPGRTARQGGITLHRDNIARVAGPCDEEVQP